MARTKGGASADSAKARRLRFVEAYIANGENATQAAIEAGYSPKTAASQGGRLLQHVEVKKALAARRAKLRDEFELRSADVIRSLSNAVHFDPRKLFDEDGNLKSVQDLDDATADALTGIEVTELKSGEKTVTLQTKRIRWADKNSARDQAMKHLGLYERDNAQKTDPIKELLGLVDGSTTGL